ncbi:MAG: hypothetical protein PHR87_07120 [Sulfurospirillaceae bacterium]|nr:hypothetical protein [Sulfurospirillaceae bacterium]
MKTPKISKKEIKKVVSISQKIEGYKPASKSLQEKAKEIMAKHHVKISA